MILFSSKKLEEAIVEDKISNWQKAKYIIIPLVISAPVATATYMISPIYVTRPPDSQMFIRLLLVIISSFITYYGIKLCFKKNSQIDGRHFIERFFILSLPVLIKLTIVLIFISGFISVLTFNKDQPTSFPINSLLVPIYTIIYYTLLVLSFKRLKELFASKGLLNKNNS